jgi:uncharacterized protein DUF87
MTDTTRAKVTIGDGLAMSALELATQVTAAIGMRGSGKSNVMAVIAEQLLGVGIPVVVLDYVGLYFGLRLKADGKTPSGLDIPVLGGPHGDIPLLPTAGEVVARSLAEGDYAAVLDISRFTKGERARFATEFAETFLQVKRDQQSPVWLLVGEAQRFMPQKPQPDQARMLGAFEEMCEVGRNFGVGLGMDSQRPQKINKECLNLADNVLALRLNGAHERKAMAAWVQEKDAPGRDDVANELPQLKRGEALVWSPVRDLYGKFSLHKKTTLDTGATPIARRASLTIKPLDLQGLEKAMAGMIEKAKADDPGTLRDRIADLEELLDREKALRESTETELQHVRERQRTPVPTVPAALPPIIETMNDTLERALERAESATAELRDALTTARAGRQAIAKLPAEPTDSNIQWDERRGEKPAPTMAEVSAATMEAWRKDRPESTTMRSSRKEFTKPHIAITARIGREMGRCERAILTALIQRGRATVQQVAILSGYSRTSSGFQNALGALRSAAFIEGRGAGAELRATPAGEQALGERVRPLPRGRALLEHWMGLPMMGKCERALLQVLSQATGGASKERLAAAAQYSVTSSGFQNALGKLRTLELVRGRGGEPITLAPELR